VGAGANELLVWASGPGLAIALAVCFAGIALRLVEIFAPGRRPDLAAPRAVTPGSGMRTVWTRSLPPQGMLRRSPATYLGGYVFHAGFFVVVVFAVPHIAVVRDLAGIGWPGLPEAVIDAAAAAGIAALAVLLASRLLDPVKRLLSGFGDYFAWVLSMLPLVTGFAAHHGLHPDYALLLALHILSAEALLVALPFTKLAHAFTAFVARWYNGDISARKGVAS